VPTPTSGRGIEKIGDEVDARGENKDPDFRRAAARRMGSTVAGPETLAATDEHGHDSGDEADDTGLGKAVVETGVSTLGPIAESALPK
jgi:hypothetical protein